LLNRYFISIAVSFICATTALLAQDKDAVSTEDKSTICPNDEELAVSLTTEFDNKYIFRGVNSLPGSGIATLDAEFEYQDFSFEIWEAAGISKSYDEFDFTLKHSWKWKKDFTFSVGYMNYYTPNDDHLRLGYSDTQEIFASIERNIGKWLTGSLKYNYDFDKIRGGFVEPRIAASFSWEEFKLNFKPYLSITYDLQYNSDRFAWNNFQTGIEIGRPLTDKLTVSATAEVSVPLAAIDDFAKKEGWVGLRLTADF
jgi:hypothetical protein